MTADLVSDNREFRLDRTKRTWTIFLVSVVGLFLEMLLIRWISTEIRIFAYLQNTILIVCFLGLGLGFFTCRKPIKLYQALIPLILLLVFMAIPQSRDVLAKISESFSVLEDLFIWDPIHITDLWLRIFLVSVALLLTFGILLLVVDIFIPIGRLLGRLIDEHPNTVWAYSVNIAGSLIGTWLFILLSYLRQPLFVWFLVLGCLLLVLIIWVQDNLKVNLAMLIAVVVLSWFAGLVPGAVEVTWSPYQKLVVRELEGTEGYLVTVNNTGYQGIVDLSAEHTSADPGVFPPELQGLSQYDIPLLLHPHPQTYLIVGAGSGNDAAGGVRQNVAEITAVEIDPAIISIGQRFHPEQPYVSPTVRVVNDDARSFFATTTQKFDVISFSLLDSHTTTAMTNARLDHYVYTRESIAQAKTLLAENGVMVLTFEAQKAYIADRMAKVLAETFGEMPMVFRVPRSSYGWGGVMFIAGDLDGVQQQVDQNQRLSAYISKLQQRFPQSLPLTTKVATDDWPYIYLEYPRIPTLYYLLAGLMVVLFVLSSRWWKASSFISHWQGEQWHFFFLGAAFLLLEVQNISKASVVLGNTWQTNAAIISGVLIMALAANALAYKFPRINISAIYAVLVGTSLALYFVDLARFAFLPYMVKGAVVGSLTTLPMLFSGIIFIRSFANVKNKDKALGANMVGALVGALLQSITFVVGIKALLLIVAGLYLLSMLFKPVIEVSNMSEEVTV